MERRLQQPKPERGWYELEAVTGPVRMDNLYKTNNVLSNQLWTVAHFLEHLHSLH